VRSTFETTNGSSEISSTTLASASAEVIDAKPKPDHLAIEVDRADQARERQLRRA